jgi:hypothetical protein
MKTSNKKSITVLIIIIIILISFFVYRNNKNKDYINIINDDKAISESKELIASNSYEIKLINKKDNLYTKIDIKYPYFKNADEKFNSDIENFIKEKISDHEKISEENWKARYDTQTNDEKIAKIPTDDEKFYLHSEVEIIQSNANYISFILRIDGYEGGAHGYVNDFPYNYDIKNKKILSLKDIFSNNYNYLKYLSNEARIYLKEKYATLSEENKKGFSSEEEIKQYEDNSMSMINDGTSLQEDNFKIFTFTPDEVKIYFSQYQVGPYVIGMPSFEVPIK